MVSDIGFARLDIDREARTGDPEVVYGAGKSPEQVVAALRTLAEAHPDRAVFATRCDDATLALCQQEFRGDIVDFDHVARTIVVGRLPIPTGTVAVVAAGSSDLPVAREAVAAVAVYGSRADLIVDVGVSGLHRLLAVRDRLDSADALVVVAGMEGALPSVVGGLVGTPLIAVPTSVGYGLSMDGLTALLAMLNSCAPGITIVNIDNGFGAGVAAARIARASGHRDRGNGQEATDDSHAVD